MGFILDDVTPEERQALAVESTKQLTQEKNRVNKCLSCKQNDAVYNYSYNFCCYECSQTYSARMSYQRTSMLADHARSQE